MRYQLEALTTEQDHAWEEDLVPFLHAQKGPDAFLAFGSRNTWAPHACRKVEITTDDKATADRVAERFAAHPLIHSVHRVASVQHPAGRAPGTR